MTSPFLQPAWTIEEAVLLVKASESIASGVTDAETEVGRLSERLRKGAALTGLTVSARYRNEDDVRNHLRSMSSMLKMIDSVDAEYLQGSTLGSVALYYRRQPDRFARLLEKANDAYPAVDSVIQAESDGNKDNNELSDHSLFVFKDEGAAIRDNADGIDNDTEDESDEFNTVNEGVATYHTPRRKRPRISNGTPGIVLNETAFSSAFPYFSSRYTSTQRLDGNKSLADSLCENGDREIAIQLNANRNKTSNFKLTNIREILVTKFPRGYRMGSALDRKRFKQYYKSSFKKSVGATEEVVEGYIRNLGFEYDGKVYITDAVLSDEVMDRICGFINDVLSTERDYVFFTHLYNQFKDDIEGSITDLEMLKRYLRELKRKDWIFKNDYIASSFDVTVSVKDELIRYMQDVSDVMEIDKVKCNLEYLPSEEVENEWNRNSDILISNGRNERFHIGLFYYTEETLNTVASLIESGLKNAPFMTSEGLFEDINRSVPELIDNNHLISALGIRNALANLLTNRFSFRNNVISSIIDSYDGPAAIMAFCKDRGYFTFSDIEDISEKIRCAPNFYLDKIYEQSVRIDAYNFVPKSQISFDVKEIDRILDLFVTDLYTVVDDILTYDAFPSCGEYSWNKWILENYLLTSSNKYCLIRPKYLSKESVTGAIVRRDGLIKTHDDLIIQAIANSDIPIEEEAANEYLYEKGIINAKRKNGQVKKVLMKAREYRNRIIKNKN